MTIRTKLSLEDKHKLSFVRSLSFIVTIHSISVFSRLKNAWISGNREKELEDEHRSDQFFGNADMSWEKQFLAYNRLERTKIKTTRM